MYAVTIKIFMSEIFTRQTLETCLKTHTFTSQMSELQSCWRSREIKEIAFASFHDEVKMLHIFKHKANPWRYRIDALG